MSPRRMNPTTGRVTPKRLMAVFGAFFVIYGVISLSKGYWKYALWSAGLAAIWFALAAMWSDKDPN